MLRSGQQRETSPSASPTLLVLGAPSAGKSTLLAASKLSSSPTLASSTSSTSACAFGYAELIDGDEVIARAGVWESRPGLEEITSSLPKPVTAIVLVLDGSRPWELGASLSSLLTCLQSSLPSPLPSPDALRQRFLSYREPGAPAVSVDASALDLPAGVLEQNLGVPIVVAVTKSDLFSAVAQELDYKDAHWDFIQTYLRRVCLRYGAALIFCSARKELNTGVLGDYVRHLLFNTTFNHPAQLLDRESLFVPLGWDSSAKIAIDFSNQKITNDPALPFEDAIKRPAQLSTSAVSEGVVSAEEDQVFLQTQLTIIGHAARTGADSSSVAVPVAEAPRTPVKDSTPAKAPLTPLPASPLPLPATPSASPAPNDHAVLSNFFNNLINKDRASPLTRK
jgi:dynein light intermediate chain 1